MYTEKLDQIMHELTESMDDQRYRHTLGVMYTAAALAMRYEADMEEALMAGLLHDCAKGYSSEKKIELCKEYHLAIEESEQKNPGLLHAKLGAYLAREKYGVESERIQHAIEFHTTGCPDMNLLDQILYIADYIEPNRCVAPNLNKWRHMAFINLEECLYGILEDSLTYLQEKNEVIDPMTERSYRYYKEKLKKV